MSGARLGADLARAVVLDRELQAAQFELERALYLLETDVLEQTSAHGNLVVGWDGFVDAKFSAPRGRAADKDRLFSLSSATLGAAFDDAAWQSAMGAFAGVAGPSVAY